MAAQLMAEFHLLVARAELQVSHDEDRIELRLYRHTGQNRQSFANARWPVSRREPPPSGTDYADRAAAPFDLDACLAATLGDQADRISVEMAAAGLDPLTPIWLHLVKPYGALGALPWEFALDRLLGRPVLRLPDYTERPPENTRTLDAAVCCDVCDEPAEIARAEAIIRAILGGSSRTETQIYVFSPPLAQRALKAAFASERRVWVAPAVKVQPSDSMPWIESLQRGLKGRSVDYVHFLGRAAYTLGGPALALADPRLRPGESKRLRLCSPQALAAGLMSLGAWALGLSPSRDQPDDTLRQFGDALAQVRPGGVIYARDVAELGRACEFLFAPRVAWPPRLREAMIYCHPSRVPEQVMGVDDPLSPTLQNAHLFGEAASFQVRPSLTERLFSVVGLAPPQASTANTPVWLAATQRYVETTSLEAVRAHSSDALQGASWSSPDGIEPAARFSLTAAQDSEAATVHDTLSEIQSIVADFANKVESGHG